MKSLALHIQSSLDSLQDCLDEIAEATLVVRSQEEAEEDPVVSSSTLDRISAHCLKARRELQALTARVKSS